jgi:hypothetical protein
MPVLGTDIQTGDNVELTSEARRQGVYVIGTTGTGKTTLLQNIAYQDMTDPQRPGLCVLDPHGDFIDKLLLRVPRDRREDVILFAPGDKEQRERPLGLNVLDCNRGDDDQVQRVVSTVISTLYKLFSYSWGPRMEDLLRVSLLTLMEKPDTTLLDLWLLLASEEHRKYYTSNLRDPVSQHFWEMQFSRYNKQQVVEVVGSSLNKIGRFLSDKRIRNIVAQPKNAFSMRRIMDEGKILLVNLSKGDLGEDNSSLLGAVLVNLILIAALQRRDTPEDQRKRFHLIVDEYQSFATESFPTLQSEARKYGIDVIVAHQYRDQLDDLNKGSTLNVANFIVLRVSGRDSFDLAAQFDNTPPAPEIKIEPVYERSGDGRYKQLKSATGSGVVYHEVKQQPRPYNDVAAEQANHLSILPNQHALCRLVNGRDLNKYFCATLPPSGTESPQMAAAIRQKSAERGKPRREVEAEIERRIGNQLDFGDIPEASEE